MEKKSKYVPHIVMVPFQEMIYDKTTNKNAYKISTLLDYSIIGIQIFLSNGYLRWVERSKQRHMSREVMFLEDQW